MKSTPELRLAIYTLCHPDTKIRYGNYGGTAQFYIHGKDCTEAQLGTNPACIPDYFNDLNACAEFEKTLDIDIHSGDSPRYAYAGWIYRLTTELEQPFRAPAAIRAEAFLRVKLPHLFHEATPNVT
jgi:hypothetical protein